MDGHEDYKTFHKRTYKLINCNKNVGAVTRCNIHNRNIDVFTSFWRHKNIVYFWLSARYEKKIIEQKWSCADFEPLLKSIPCNTLITDGYEDYITFHKRTYKLINFNKNVGALTQSSIQGTYWRAAGGGGQLPRAKYLTYTPQFGDTEILYILGWVPSMKRRSKFRI